MQQLPVDHGFVDVTHLGVEEAARRYFGGTDVGLHDLQRLVTAVVAEQ